MDYRELGDTGLTVSHLALGTMNFGFARGPDQHDATDIVSAALDVGVTLVDTADVYSRGRSEEMVGRALRGRRDRVVLASKFGLPMGADPEQRGGSARWVTRAVEESLTRLRTDHIDLYQMHRMDPETPVEDTLLALSDLIDAGKVRAVGHSTFPAEAIVEAQWAADRLRVHRFATEQPRYSILNRTPEAHVFPTAMRHRMGVLTYGPLASGWLSGRADPTQGSRGALEARSFDLDSPGNRAKVDAVERLSALAAGTGIGLAQLALGFARAHPAVTSTLLGPRTVDQMRDLSTGADVRLTDDVLDRIDEIVPPGTDLNPADNYAADVPALVDRRLRRRQASDTVVPPSESVGHTRGARP